MGKSVERLRRKAIGPVKWQPAATLFLEWGALSDWMVLLWSMMQEG